MSGEILHGRELSGPLEESVDVVVVGSGAGGAVFAAQLAEDGKSVLVLEEGPHYTPEEIRAMTPSQVLRRMWRDAGMYAALGVGQTPVISLAMGRNVGGSSVHTGGVCFRIPSAVHHDWVKGHGLPELSEAALEAAYLDVERRVHVVEVQPHERSRSTQKFAEGAAKLGVEFKNLRRNTDGCEGNSRCNFGCPKGAKMSVDLSYLPGAIARGARLVSDAQVERVLFDGTRAVGVEGWLTGPPGHYGARKHRFKIHAKIVVVACGTVHTPEVLANSGVRSKHLGRHITLHPAFRMGGLFDEPLDPWNGAMQSAYSDHYEHEGITFVGMYPPVNVLSSGLPGVGPSHRAIVRQNRSIAVQGGMVHDEGGGVLHRSPLGGREPLLTYEMVPRDLARVRRAITLLGEMAFAAGAKAVIPPIFGLDPITSLSALRALETSPPDARKIECMAFHPLGSAKMSNDPRRGVTDVWGAVYGMKGLYVVDGSVLPTSIGVNSQVPIMSMATRLAWAVRDRWARVVRG